jgi:hypothetical protein
VYGFIVWVNPSILWLHNIYPSTQFNIGSVILDSGTTDIYFPVDVFDRIKDHLLDTIQPFGNITRANLSDFFDGRSKLAFNRYSLDYLFTHLPPLRIGLPSADDASRQFYLVLPPQVGYLCCCFVLVLRWLSCDHSGGCHVTTAAGRHVVI